MSRASVISVLTGVALIAVAIALGQWLADGNDQTAQIEVGRKQAVPALPPASLNRVTATSNRNTPLPASNLGLDQRWDRGSALVRASTAPVPHVTGAPPQDGTSEAAIVEPEDPDPRAAVIGRPFAVSASVAAALKLDNRADLDQLLSQFSHEPRDPTWAQDMETKLRDFVVADSGQFKIRNLECRNSLCFIEVASVNGPFIDGISLNPTLHAQLISDVGEFGYERAGITVTLMPFTRR